MNEQDEIATLREENQRLWAKIGRLTDLCASLEVKLYGERLEGARGGLAGQVVNPGDPGHVPGSKPQRVQ